MTRPRQQEWLQRAMDGLPDSPARPEASAAHLRRWLGDWWKGRARGNHAAQVARARSQVGQRAALAGRTKAGALDGWRW